MTGPVIHGFRFTCDELAPFTFSAVAALDDYLYRRRERADDIILLAGYRIGPLEVEDALVSHPAVAEAAVVGSPHPERGEIVKAFVILSPGFEPSETI